MDDIQIIPGEIFTDHRGTIQSLNNFRFDDVNRFYFITNKDCDIIRGWHGHKTEKKWFYCVKGAFVMAFVKIDDWDKPSKNLKPEILRISDKKSEIIAVPEGYANCIKAIEPDSKLLVFSGRTYPECLDDSWRYEPNYWFDWNTLK